MLYIILLAIVILFELGFKIMDSAESNSKEA